MKDPKAVENELKRDGAPPIMRQKDVADRAGVDPRTVRRWDLPRLPNGRYLRSDVAAYFARR